MSIAKIRFLACVVTLSFDVFGTNGLRILGIFTINGKSHFLIQEQIMLGLAKKGHQVHVYSHFPQKKMVPNYIDYSLEGLMPSTVNNISYETVSDFKNMVNMKMFMSVAGIPHCEILEAPIFQKLLEEGHSKFDLVITEVFVSSCHLPWGRYFKVPIIGISCPPVLMDWMNSYVGNPLNLATDATLFYKNVPPLSFIERLQNFIYSTLVSLSANYYMAEQNKYIEKYFGPDMTNARDIYRDLSLILVNYNLAISGVRAFTPSVIPIGGAHIKDKGEPLPLEVKIWLDEAIHGCVYFSFGSMVRIETLPKAKILVIYKTFENLFPVRVLMKIPKKEELPPGLPKNVMTQPWFSQVEVLKHKNLKAFVTHGGLLGTQESIYFGVPLVGIPLFGDQSFNLKTYASRKVALEIELENLNEESFTNSLLEVLQNPVYRKNAELMSRKFKDTPLTPVETAVFWIEYISRHGKDALKSPLVDMPWWKSNLLDVYAFILTVLLICLYIFVKITKFIALVILSLHKSRYMDSPKIKMK